MNWISEQKIQIMFEYWNKSQISQKSHLEKRIMCRSQNWVSASCFNFMVYVNKYVRLVFSNYWTEWWRKAFTWLCPAGGDNNRLFIHSDVITLFLYLPGEHRSRLKKTQNIMNMWLQHDLSILGRIILTKAEDISRLVYPALSLFVQDSTLKDIDKTLANSTWKN